MPSLGAVWKQRSEGAFSFFHMKTTRTAIGKKLRFTIFSRDNYTCRYCGRQSDAVVLHVDHVQPVCDGGTNDPENLITSCADCNLGKGGRSPSQAAPTEADRLRLAQERNEQAAAFVAAKVAVEERAKMRALVLDYWCDARGAKEMDRSTLNTIMSYVGEFGVETVLQWIDKAVARCNHYDRDSKLGRYVSGIRRRVLEERQ